MGLEQTVGILASLGAFSGLAVAVGWWVKRRTARRSEIREPLADFAELVQATGAGQLTAQNTDAGLDRLLADVDDKAVALRRSMNLGRSAAGNRWCHKVYALIRTGWQLSALCSAMGQGLKSNSDGYEKLRALMERFEAEYRRLL